MWATGALFFIFFFVLCFYLLCGLCVRLIGNGWAAMGMLRIYVTIQKSKFAAEMKEQSADLIAWVKEILDGTFKAIVRPSIHPSLSEYLRHL